MISTAQHAEKPKKTHGMEIWTDNNRVKFKESEENRKEPCCWGDIIKSALTVEKRVKQDAPTFTFPRRTNRARRASSYHRPPSTGHLDVIIGCADACPIFWRAPVAARPPLLHPPDFSSPRAGLPPFRAVLRLASHLRVKPPPPPRLSSPSPSAAALSLSLNRILVSDAVLASILSSSRTTSIVSHSRLRKHTPPPAFTTLSPASGSISADFTNRCHSLQDRCSSITIRTSFRTNNILALALVNVTAAAITSAYWTGRAYASSLPIKEVDENERIRTRSAARRPPAPALEVERRVSRRRSVLTDIPPTTRPPFLHSSPSTRPMYAVPRAAFTSLYSPPISMKYPPSNLKPHHPATTFNTQQTPHHHPPKPPPLPSSSPRTSLILVFAPSSRTQLNVWPTRMSMDTTPHARVRLTYGAPNSSTRRLPPFRPSSASAAAHSDSPSVASKNGQRLSSWSPRPIRSERRGHHPAQSARGHPRHGVPAHDRHQSGKDDAQRTLAAASADCFPDSAIDIPRVDSPSRAITPRSNSLLPLRIPRSTLANTILTTISVLSRPHSHHNTRERHAGRHNTYTPTVEAATPSTAYIRRGARAPFDFGDGKSEKKALEKSISVGTDKGGTKATASWAGEGGLAVGRTEKETTQGGRRRADSARECWCRYEDDEDGYIMDQRAGEIQ
ncbi:hypothetical protein R3P38DRAFT_3227195 [Favolaschia claudopus]|uniref:Uncharacterized protein n=1 Tax=Favolaschia claudopus TaxID=2862362 RepID=A0AAV9ZTI6_9AGAR